ncbi:MAG: AMP-binding protein, partial [Actinomycetota bacterium]
MGELNFGRMLARAPMFGDDLAVHDLGNGHRSTYLEHVERVGHLCAAMRELGVRPGDRVGVLAGAGHVYIELWRACLSGAGVITPLNTRLAPDELVYILDDSATEIVFVDGTFAPMIAAIRTRLPKLAKVVLIGDGDGPCDVRLNAVLGATEPGPLPPQPDDDASAALLYTGGTTGLPKGVLLSQKAIALTICRVQIAGHFRPATRFLSFMPMFHIGSIAGWGLLAATGGATIILPEFEPGAALTAIRDHGITFTGAVPTMLAMMVAHPDYAPGMLSSLELVMYGAAPMPPDLLDRLLGEYPDLSFMQSYGMTESAGAVSALL